MLKQFYEKALPTQGVYCATGIEPGESGKGKATNKFAESIDELLKQVEFIKKKGWNTYVALGTFEGYSRKKDDCLYFRSFFIDLDVGEDKAASGKGYATKEAALEAVGIKPAGLAFVPDWPYIPNFAVGARNFIGALNGTHSETVPLDPVNQGGTKTIGTPGGPVITVPTKPGEPPHPPGNGTKEKKARVGAGLFKVAQSLFHGITEYGDLVDALFDAIPKAKRCKTKSLVGKSMCVFTHLDDIDIGDAIVNIAWNEFEDRIIGAGFGLNAKAAKARGDRYAFRTQNSVNGFGGVDQLGELYGDFSKEYVNPRKQDLKDFLSRKFGI